ncbi:MAG: division/cell wall cluster transcriptional repressor MraZ [Prevotella multiformis]|uniref:division/cell wall cluster transcriptional repressor MraZ n=1 Tax=Prevotella multiformis TaxID=282402 RepID=UPI003F9F101B
MRFLGNIEAKTDAKGRAFLPAVFRKVLNASGEDSLVLRKDIFEPCLVLYPESVWNERMDTLRRRLSRWNRRDQMIYRQYVTDVEMITLDGNGRFLIPKRYLKLANIDQQIRFTGMDDCIEIWSNSEDSTPFMPAEEFSKAMEEAMGADGFPFSGSHLPDGRPDTTNEPAA